MAKAAPSGLQVMTAYSLRHGSIVFLGPDNRWVDSIADAQITGDAERAKAFEREGQAAKAANIVVDPYLIEVSETRVPVRLRERFRLEGPTVGNSRKEARRAEIGK